jgi:hypothetical protein
MGYLRAGLLEDLTIQIMWQTDRSPSRGMKDAVENSFEKPENLSACILGPSGACLSSKAKIAS